MPRPSARQRQELAEFLRKKRGEVSPDDVGLFDGPRRRVSGLRRNEVAILAGVSVSWYKFLEQARDVHPSADTLDRLATILRLTEDERRYVHVLARGHVSTLRPLEKQEPDEGLCQQLVRTCAELSAPVYAMDLYTNVLGANEAALTWYDDFGGDTTGRNALRWMLFDPGSRYALRDWEYEVSDVVARWRGGTAKRGRDETMLEMIGEFRRESEVFERAWTTFSVQEHRSRFRLMRHHRLGASAFRLVVARVQELYSAVVVFHVAEPSEEGARGS